MSLIYFVYEDEIELYERGNLWKYMNKIPISFNNIEEKMRFFISIGEYEMMETIAIDKPLLKEYLMNRKIDGFIDLIESDNSYIVMVIKLSDINVGTSIRNEIIENLTSIK